MNTDKLICNKETLAARMEALRLMTPGDLRRIGIMGKPSVPCTGNYIHKEGTFYQGEYPIGRDC